MSKELTQSRGSMSIAEDRWHLMLEAAWEIDALASTLPQHVPRTEDAQQAHLVVRGVSARLQQLANLLMAGLGDDAVKTEKISGLLLCEGHSHGL